MDNLGHSILELKSSDNPAILADIILLQEQVHALQGSQQFASLSLVAEAGTDSFDGTQPVSQSTYFIAQEIAPFFRLGYSQGGTDVSTNRSEGPNLYRLRENHNLPTSAIGLRWERRANEPTLVKFLITACTTFRLVGTTSLKLSLQIALKDASFDGFNYPPRYGNDVLYPVKSSPNDAIVSHRVMWAETVDLTDTRIQYIDFKIVGQSNLGAGIVQYVDYFTGGFSENYENFISVQRIQ